MVLFPLKRINLLVKLTFDHKAKYLYKKIIHLMFKIVLIIPLELSNILAFETALLRAQFTVWFKPSEPTFTYERKRREFTEM